MKLSLALSPSFSRELFSFRATAPSNGRGEVEARWHGSQGAEARRRERWVHPFDEARLRSILKVLEGLPARCGPSVDDVGEREIGIEDSSAGLQVVRVRARVNLRADEPARAFDALWRELYEPIKLCLIQLQVPSEFL